MMVATTSKDQKDVIRKRKADVLGRAATSSTAGRGSESGWTTCPLCGRHSKKRYALGRGIAAHLHAVHTPWNPGKMELKKKLRQIKRQQAEQKRRKKQKPEQKFSEEADSNVELATWEPTLKEREEWDQRVLELTAELESKAKENEFDNLVGVDRTGNKSLSYRESLSPFLQAAAVGNIEDLTQLVGKCLTSAHMRTLINTRDRNGSTAEHWAAGGGHLSCLKYLLQQRQLFEPEPGKTTTADSNQAPRRVRRRDGKTCLHYAARNGHVACIQFLLKEGFATVDEVSGDGTTPLHMACYGGHVDVVEFLLKQGADVHATNEWECGAAHWVGMTRCDAREDVRRLCRTIQGAGVSFVVPQKQGHCALHKACQRRNKAVIEWMADDAKEGGAGLSTEEKKRAGQPDDGKHLPSEIWLSVGGESSFAKWMQTQCRW